VYALFGITAFVIFLAIAAPASLMEGAVARASRNTIAMANTSGSVWRGSGDLDTRPAASPPLRIGRIEWTINPLWLLTGKININVSLTASGTALTGAARIGFGSLTLRNLNATFPAQLVPVFYAPAELIGPAGQIGITAPALAWSRKDGITGTAEVLWQDAASSFSTVRPLGDYRLSLEGQGGPVEMKLETLNGALRFAGQGTLDITEGAFRLSGNASAQERVGELATLLNMIRPGPDSAPRPFNLEFSWRK
jgi:general secretion pathway protein N